MFSVPVYLEGNLIRMLLMHLHLTHQNVLLEPFDVQETFWVFFISLFKPILLRNRKSPVTHHKPVQPPSDLVSFKTPRDRKVQAFPWTRQKRSPPEPAENTPSTDEVWLLFSKTKSFLRRHLSCSPWERRLPKPSAKSPARPAAPGECNCLLWSTYQPALIC